MKWNVAAVYLHHAEQDAIPGAKQLACKRHDMCKNQGSVEALRACALVLVQLVSHGHSYFVLTVHLAAVDWDRPWEA